MATANGCIMAGASRMLAVLALVETTVMAEKEGSEPESPVGVAISVMLLGSMCFFMSLFYLVNYPDDDIKRYSWQVVSSTLSIFCAVLLFTGLNGLVTEYIVDDTWKRWEYWAVTVNTAQVLIWMLVLNVVLAFTSGSFSKKGALREVQLNTECWAVLFAHLTGFATINAIGGWQHLPFFAQSDAHSLLVLPIGLLVLLVLYQILYWLRETIAKGDDAKIDEYEKVWDDASEDAEMDIAGLSLSFAAVQSLRYHVSGVLPDVEGVEGDNTAYTHDPSQVYKMLGMSVIFVMLAVIFLFIGKKTEEDTTPRRMASIMQHFCSNAFAWSVFFGAQWALYWIDFTRELALLHVSLAIVLSFVSFVLIFGLDKVADYEGTGSSADKAIRSIVVALGVLVGFSWERSFDTATDYAVNSLLPAYRNPLSKLLLSLALSLIVLPAWRIYILPNALRAEKGIGTITCHLDWHIIATDHQYWRELLRLSDKSRDSFFRECKLREDTPLVVAKHRGKLLINRRSLVKEVRGQGVVDLEVTACVLKVTVNSVMTEHAYMMQGDKKKRPKCVAVLQTLTMSMDKEDRRSVPWTKRDFDWLNGAINRSSYADENLKDLFMGDASAPPAPGTAPTYKFMTRPSDLDYTGHVSHYHTLSFFIDARALRKLPDHDAWHGDIHDLQMEFGGHMGMGEVFDIQLWEHPRTPMILGRLSRCNGTGIGRAVFGFDGGRSKYHVNGFTNGVSR